MQSRLRSCAIALPGVSEKVILDRISFTVRGKTFATEGWPEEGWAVVKLSLADQKRLCASIAIRPEPERGAAGVTLVRLPAVEDDVLAEVLTAAWTLAYGDARSSSRADPAAAGQGRASQTPSR
ncbi:MAG: MmcQ/YjbR family DNA-binding protein [Caulobacter sp.]|nr:MmcQ/YjbR family DNA-binding protein [Caulobacter sp.]